MKVLHWSELPGNKYLLKLDPVMLENCFFAEQTIGKIAVLRSQAPERIRVHYDRDYVIAKLLSAIVTLKIESTEQLIELMIDVWDQRQNTNLSYDNYKAGWYRLLRLCAGP